MSTVLKFYQEVIEDVVNSVREMFLESGVDEQVLQELKQAWETKLFASKAVDNHSEIEKQGIKKSGDITNGFQKAQAQVVKQVVGQVAPNNHVQTQAVAQVETNMVPIQITLPAQPGANVPQRVLTIQVPATALQDNQLHKVLTGPVITATMNLPPHIASSLLQQHVNSAFSQGTNVIGSVLNTTTTTTTTTKSVIQNDGVGESDDVDDVTPSCSTSGSTIPNMQLFNDLLLRKLKQIDGSDDTSDDDEDGSDDDDPSDDNDDDKDEDEQEMDEGGPEEEPLNSEDDVTDEDPADLFDTENIVVCLYDKITRSRNKWKFHLKEGIMNLNGEDFVFHKASGDAEW